MIAYDISDAKIRRQISKHLENHGQRIQYSVFECRLNKKQQHQLHHTLTQLIDSWDKIRWYPLCRCCEQDIHWQGNGKPTDDNTYYLL